MKSHRRQKLRGKASSRGYYPHGQLQCTAAWFNWSEGAHSALSSDTWHKILLETVHHCQQGRRSVFDMGVIWWHDSANCALARTGISLRSWKILHFCNRNRAILWIVLGANLEQAIGKNQFFGPDGPNLASWEKSFDKMLVESLRISHL